MSSLASRFAFCIMTLFTLPVSYALIAQMPSQSIYNNLMPPMNPGMSDPFGNCPGMPTQHYHHHYHHHYLYPSSKSTAKDQNATAPVQHPQIQQSTFGPHMGPMSPGGFPQPLGAPSPYYSPQMNPMFGGNFNPMQNPFMPQSPPHYSMPFGSPYSDPNMMRMMMQRRMGMPMPNMNTFGDPMRSLGSGYMGYNMMSDPLLYAAQPDLFSSTSGFPGIQDPLGMNMLSGMPGINDPMSNGMMFPQMTDLFGPSLHHHHRLLASMGASGTNMFNMLGRMRRRGGRSRALRRKKCRCRLVLH